MFYLIDKPLGISSFDVIRKLRKILDIKKMWHTGTLDPLATGALLIATGNSTKLIPLLEWARKEYVATIVLDGSTDSLDLWTPIISKSMVSYKEKSPTEIKDYILSVKTQVPPLYSALHIDGERAYDLARKGKEFIIESRPVEVYEAEILRQTARSIDLRIVLSSGWYVRSFAPLIARFLGVEWGYISALRRTQIYTTYGPLNLIQASTLDTPIELSYSQIFPTIPTISISERELADIKNGKALLAKNVANNEEGALVFLQNGEYISLTRHEWDKYTIIRNNV